jgi:hypothetical protein
MGKLSKKSCNKRLSRKMHAGYCWVSHGKQKEDWWRLDGNNIL